MQDETWILFPHPCSGPADGPDTEVPGPADGPDAEVPGPADGPDGEVPGPGDGPDAEASGPADGSDAERVSVREGQGHDEARAAPTGGVDRDGTAAGHGDALHDREAETAASGIPAARLVE